MLPWQNEVLFDIWEQPWEPDLPNIVEAVFIAYDAEPAAILWARASHAAIVELVAPGSPSRVPLLFYNMSDQVGRPFWPMDSSA